jgi:glycosyltransferase involved in cell wall biosynthesis
MAGKIPAISIVCPAFQEEDVLPFFHRELCTVLGRLDGPCNLEIIYVDDGSTDGTLQVLRELAAADKRIRYLSLSRNFGHQAALTAGLEHSRGDVIITMDSDLQHPPALLPTLLKKWREGFDIVLTIREDDPRLSSFKRYTSRWFYRIMSFLSDTDIRLAAADYRLMSRKAVDALLQLRETHRFLRGMVGWLGFPVAEIPFQPAVRKAGVSKYTFRKMFNFALDGMLSFSKLPLRLALVLGVVTILVSLFLSGWAIVRLLLPHGGTDLGSALLIISTQFIGGCILLCLGIIGEYVGRIYQQVQGRPIYLLKEYWPQSPADLTGFPADRVTPKPVGWSPNHDQTAA